jgi:glycosyltransferase involved in cell wall biosynthesis
VLGDRPCELIITDVSGPDRKQAISTLSFPRRPAWRERVEMLDPSRMPRLALARRLLRESKRHEAVVLNGSGSPVGELSAGAIISRRRRPPRIIVADCVWGWRSRSDRLASRTALALLDGSHVHYCVHSRAQKERFPELWGVDAERVHVTPYYYTLSEEELAVSTERDGTVFAGGDSHRDYRPLIEAAREIDAPVVLATGRLSEDQRARAPRNVSAPGRVPHERFVDLMRRASAVVVPLESRDDRSAGEQTYLNAMVMGKPVIVVDSMGVREYVSDGETGLVVPPGDPGALAAALAWALDPANEVEVERMTERARETALARYGPDHYVAGLLRVLDEVLQKKPEFA